MEELLCTTVGRTRERLHSGQDKREATQWAGQERGYTEGDEETFRERICAKQFSTAEGRR